MTTRTRTTALLLILTFSLAASAFAAQEKPTGQTEYDAGIERLRRGDATVDIRRLRHLWAGLPDYDPYAEGGNHKATVAAVRAGNVKEALRLARQDLEADYLDVDAQMAAMMACRQLGDEKASEHHRAVVVGILKSITEFGDGASPGTAYTVVTVREEYAVLRAFGLGMKSQELLTGPEHSFDVMTVVDPETKKETTIYFNIDLLMAHQEKMFEKKPENPKEGADGGGRVGGVVGGVTSAPPGGVLGGVPADPTAAGVHRVDGGVLPGKARVRPQPEYPKMASAAGVAGAVVVEVVVSETGTVESARIISGHPLLRDVALAAAKAWVFDPTLLDGVPVKVVGTLTFNFRKG